ncbi:MoxR family ATPase [Leptolyngbya boryana CZ1]|uniref:MoxR family ATPase n=1 Tax=Leptolyngbya boryana CZ1 TaxID=3060204 RepID=A0AA97ASB2_LEPBY|nr:MoxR family ATPase [Leptolyngbya boryana]WNZ47379.1 MoxR family ATPase [Leptolyngbya boryana CZ1]
MTDLLWKLFLGNGRSSALTEMPEAPGWRTFMSAEDFKQERDASDHRWREIQSLAEKDIRGKERGESFRLEDSYTDVLNMVNAALHLRRPILVTGKPGSGKTSLAYAVAHELKLGVVLTWPINARSTLQDALYRYDAVARLQDAQLKRERPMGDYIRLGPVGTAFLPSHLPRVLLIDEIDKCDINLPNDLLNLFEEGLYEIPELVRCKDEYASVDVRTADPDVFATIRGGRVACREFPFVIMTSNGERDFPPAFLRRCLRLKMPDPSQNQAALERIVEAHLRQGKDAERWARLQGEVTELVKSFVARSESETADIATDQLLNVIYLLTREVKPDHDERENLKGLLLKGLSEED